MKPTVYKRADGGVSIFYPAAIKDIRKNLRNPLLKVSEYEAHVRERAIPEDATDVFDLATDTPTEDRYFREAWDIVNGKLTTDMPKAEIIHIAQIRKARDEKLSELDIETMRGNDVQAEKQILRDLPNNIDFSIARTPEELKNIWPTELGSR